MADAFVSVAAEGILKKAASIAANEIAIAWGYKKKLDTLDHTLTIICSKLRDTEDEKGQIHGVMVWLAILKHLIGEADDLLDEVHYQLLGHEVMTRDPTRMVSLTSLKTLSIRRELGQRIENIANKFREMIKQGNNLGLQNRHPRIVPDGLDQEIGSCRFEFKIVGRQKDELHITQLLTRSRKEEKLTILPIVGIDGIGKTTLAKLVYDNLKIQQHFDFRVWLSVSGKVDVNILLAKICESIAGDESESHTRVHLITNLRMKLRSIRYLIVLDDVLEGDKEHWDDFRRCMLEVNSLNGSCFLVTTQNLEIGTKDFNEDFHVLQGLSNDESWSIFKERVFVGKSLLPELEKIGRDIVKKCRGLPLLIKVIAGMLGNCNDKDKWLFIKDSKVWDLEKEEHIIQNILKLSFDNLPNSVVKQCFTYCSLFEKNKVMIKNDVIQLWMALGLVPTDESAKKEMEDIGNDIFHVLVSSSLFKDVKTNYEITSFGIQDLVHDLSSSLSKHESLRLMHKTRNDIIHIPQVKHFAVYQDLKGRYEFETKVAMVLNEATTARSLHTLFFQGRVHDNFSFQHIKSIRILKFSGCKLEKIDDSIGELVHLRYLDLSFTQIKILPSSIGKLYHLQTLKLIGCYHCQWLPIEMKNLINLRVLEFPKLLLVNMLGQLTSLRTLPFFGVRKQKGYEIEELGHLKHLRDELHLFNLEEINNKEDALKADLSKKKNLHKIELIWSCNEGVNHNDEDVLDGLQPYTNLKSLTIVNFSGDKFPPWVINIGRLHNLTEIILSGCRSCLYLPMLEYLPLLRDLELSSMDNLTCLRSSLNHGETKNVTKLIEHCSPSLRSLKLIGMKRLEKWIDTNTIINSSRFISPVLETLQIQDCPKIILVDECYPHPLVSLYIHNCQNLVSVKSLQGLKSLESLSIHNCNSLVGVLDLPKKVNSLKWLEIVSCRKLSYLPRELFNCYSFLTKLSVGPFSNELPSFPSLQGIEKLRNHLHSLDLFGCNHWESIPEEIKHLTSLTRFIIFTFGIRELPTWLTDMSSIRDMRFYDCHKLDKETVKLGAPREADHVFLNRKRV